MEPANGKPATVTHQDPYAASPDVLTGSAAPPAPDDADDLGRLKKAELVELAEARGIDTDGLKKAELVEALED